MTDDQLQTSQRVSKMLVDGQGAAALKLVESLLAASPGDPEIQILAGDAYASTGAHTISYHQYNAAADTYHRLGQPDKVLHVQHKILNLDLNLLDPSVQIRIRLLTLLVEAEDALLVGQREKAVVAYQEAIRQFPNHTVTYQRLAAVFADLGRKAEAVEQYLTVARAFYTHGVISKALPYFEWALELNPSHAEALEALLICLTKEGRDAEMDKPIKAAVQHCLDLGLNDNARLLFARLTPQAQSEATVLHAALFGAPAEEVIPEGLLEVQGLDSVQTLAGDSVALQKAGEMCLAEEMFEEAKQVFERLLNVEPDRRELVEYLNQARAGLGLGAIIIPGLSVPTPAEATAVVATPPVPLAIPPAPAAPLRPMPPPPAVSVFPTPVAVPALLVPKFSIPAPLSPAPPKPALTSPGMLPLPAFGSVSKEEPGIHITRAQYQIQLGEMLPLSESATGFDDQIIS